MDPAGITLEIRLTFKVLRVSFILVYTNQELSPAVDGRYIPGSRYVLVYCHKVDKAHGILRLVYGAADENLAVSKYSLSLKVRKDRAVQLSCREVKVIVKSIFFRVKAILYSKV